MLMGRWTRARIPLSVQVGVVAVLFMASLIVLAYTGLSVLRREGRRESAERVLAAAGAALARQGRDDLASVPRFPTTLSMTEWEELNDRLGAKADAVLRVFEGVEGGYFVREGRRFLGASFPTEPEGVALKKANAGRRRSPDPPPREYNLIETQVDASIRKGQVIFVVEDVPPSTVAIRTAPVVVEGEIVAATWTMTRLIDPIFLDRSIRGYELAALLALGGIALALALAIRLARSLRREAAARERLQRELRRQERLAALGKLLAGVAHEIRNPLAGIRSTTQLWQRGIKPDAESLADLIDEVDRLEAIISRLLQFSRADTQELTLGDLNAVVAEAARLVEPLAHEQGVRVTLELAPDLPPVAMAAAPLLQVFRNFTTNALQAMPDGGTLRLATRLDPSGKRIEASVADTGPGLSPEARQHMFEPFFTTKKDGTGLGLAIAREIALAHHGELRAENRPEGPGAVFSLVLPVAQPAAVEEVL
jgi:two-component system sensor histidine kinase HydH